MENQNHHDVLIIGSGAAGLSLALRLPVDMRIAIIAKNNVKEGCTYYAQGGISAVMNEKDSTASHIEDTIRVGAGLCDPSIVHHVVEQGKQQIQWLNELGVAFSKEQNAADANALHLTREGGHSHRRVVHAADATGRAVTDRLNVNVTHHPNIEIFENHIAVDLITDRKLEKTPIRCQGAYVFSPAKETVQVFRARCVVLATGSASKVYLYTSNPDVSTGDGIAMAWRAGCRVANMEFIQFHPTCLYHPNAKSFLVTEAIRGEGGKLILPNGESFMQKFDTRGELASRDIVARAIDHEMKRLGIDCVYLDISHKSAEFIKGHFPTVYNRCMALGIDITQSPIPVVPAAHYTCGGVMTNRHGHTDIHSLYAIGEVAYTGFHGANRMASNSLLECLVFAAAACEHIKTQLRDIPMPNQLTEWDESRVTNSDEEVVVSHNWDELRRFMWDYVGIVRTNKRLERAKRRVDLLTHEIDEYYGHFRVTSDLIELRNLVVVAQLIVRCAIKRKESRGLHYTLDFPTTDDQYTEKNTILIPPNYTHSGWDLGV